MNQKFKINVRWSDADGVFVAEVPLLPGCMSHGRTRSDALANANDAINLWLTVAQQLGRSVPNPIKRGRPEQL